MLDTHLRSKLKKRLSAFSHEGALERRSVKVSNVR
jgi:hypothetical protein